MSVLKALHLSGGQTPATTLPVETLVLKPPTVTGAPIIEYEAPGATPPTAAPASSPPGVTVWRPAPVETYVQPPAILCRPAPVYQPLTVYRPVIALAPAPKTYVVGRGVLGQPKVYVPAQPVRNFLRWLSP